MTRREVFDLIVIHTDDELCSQYTKQQLINFQDILSNNSQTHLPGNKQYQLTICRNLVDSLRRSNKLLGTQI